MPSSSIPPLGGLVHVHVEDTLKQTAWVGVITHVYDNGVVNVHIFPDTRFERPAEGFDAIRYLADPGRAAELGCSKWCTPAR